MFTKNEIFKEIQRIIIIFLFYCETHDCTYILILYQYNNKTPIYELWSYQEIYNGKLKTWVFIDITSKTSTFIWERILVIIYYTPNTIRLNKDHHFLSIWYQPKAMQRKPMMWQCVTSKFTTISVTNVALECSLSKFLFFFRRGHPLY